MATLKEISEKLSAQPFGWLDGDAIDITHDSRQCAPGSLFVAISGARSDGNEFAQKAVEQGAVAVVSEKPPPADFAKPWLQVKDARLALALAAAEIFDHPSRKLELVGITGTNGKTTTAHLVDSIFGAAGFSSAMMGTITYRLAGADQPAERTTPEAPDIQRFLSRACAQGATHAVMEVSSHALDLKRVHGTEFAVAAFTNLTPEHLDYHGTMEQYFAAKRKLFEGVGENPPRWAVINLDDHRASELLQSARSRSSETLTYGIDTKADVSAQSFTCSVSGLEMVVNTPVGHLPIFSPLVGRAHTYNLLGAIAIGLALDIDAQAIARGISTCPRIPGRFEVVDEEQGFAVVVDYAHTSDALQNVLATARMLSPYRIITVFGCGGDRDISKRAPMGEVAGRMSDVVIVTSDNPRTEDPEAIINDIEAGLKQTGKPYARIADRRQAIRHAIREARPNDLVLIAGKGHETYQVLNGRIIPFDDRQIAREAIRERKRASYSPNPTAPNTPMMFAPGPSYAEIWL